MTVFPSYYMLFTRSNDFNRYYVFAKTRKLLGVAALVYLESSDPEFIKCQLWSVREKQVKGGGEEQTLME